MRIDQPGEGDGREDVPDRPDPDDVRHERAAAPAGECEAYRARVDGVLRAHAIDQAYDRVREIERSIVTPAMKRIEAEDPERRLAGLEHSLKGKDRLTEKINEAVDERGHTMEQAFAMVKDAIRYTFCYSEDRYTEGVRADSGRLENAGFEHVDRRNLWAGVEYKGVNSRWRVPDSGQLFEVQFHTQASLNAKEETHGTYEQIRSLPDDDAEVGKLHTYQREVTAKVPTPPGALGIPDYP